MKKFLIGIPLALILILFVCFISLSFTPKLLFTAIKALSPEANLTKPDNYSALKKNIQTKKNIIYSEQYSESSLDIYSPKKKQGKLPVILFIHGGGFFKGEKEMAKYFGPALSNGQYAFVSIDYQLVPEATLFDQLKQINQALAFINENAEKYSWDVNQLNLAGSSAGGFLALQLLSAYHDKDYAESLAIQPVEQLHINSLLLYSAVYNLAEFQSFEGSRLTNYVLGKVGWGLTGEKAWKTDKKLAKTLNLNNYIRRDFPPIFITDGNTKTFTVQAKAYTEELKRKNITTETLFFDPENAVGHGYQLNMKTLASKQAINKSLDFLEANNSQISDNDH